MSELNQDADWQEQGDEIEIEAIGIEVSSHPIELYKVFKIANLVGGGGEAKHLIAEGYVAVNGDLETRKRRKMYDGDFFEFNQEYYVVVCDAPVTEPEDKAAVKETKAKEKPARKKSKKAASTEKSSSKSHASKTSAPLNTAGLSQSADPSKKAKSQSKAKADKKAEDKSVSSQSESAPAKTRSANGRGQIDFF
ncbi:RNA-binding S4 domain-containing protein [Vibrio renipiscarius]|uniref:Uncharacterized protein n=1 Tax=Vibrio renipiscarius TaxID=1461322 RepID=A0A0C2K9Y2_9VIBR|nr:RNA-binding S4 domain-containing protein [Vibrio renipiscarius]KII75390.1 hypothetical protein OJ16_19095 [Vibrio renipiscarius]KII78843.1 hypothetical protein PL18_11205 [Vibrio renipiscarius]